MSPPHVHAWFLQKKFVELGNFSGVGIHSNDLSRHDAILSHPFHFGVQSFYGRCCSLLSICRVPELSLRALVDVCIYKLDPANE